MIKKRQLTFLKICALALSATIANAQDISIIPSGIDDNCRGGRAVLYDECGSQATLLRQAMQLAAAEGKVVLVSFGAEWCIWCHVFDQYVSGQHTKLTYRFSDPGDQDTEEVTLREKPATDPSLEAAELHQFFADRFVLVHIENYYAPDGYDVLAQTNAANAYDGALPFIFTVDAQGRYAAHFQSDAVETRRDGLFDWFRGYDRAGLTAELTRMAVAAR